MPQTTISFSVPNLFDIGWCVANVTASAITYRDHRGNVHIQKLKA